MGRGPALGSSMDGQIYRSYDDHVMQYGFREPKPAFGPGSPQPPTGAGKFRPTLSSARRKTCRPMLSICIVKRWLTRATPASACKEVGVQTMRLSVFLMNDARLSVFLMNDAHRTACAASRSADHYVTLVLTTLGPRGAITTCRHGQPVRVECWNRS